ncbi:MAG TPA: hypothetical protein VF427_14050, partial [Noviherbaspirillum sp.]
MQANQVTSSTALSQSLPGPWLLMGTRISATPSVETTNSNLLHALYRQIPQPELERQTTFGIVTQGA